MKLRRVLSLAVLAAIGCGGQPEGVVQFTGHTPNTALEKKKDSRGVLTRCPNCNGNVDFGAAKCTNSAKRCTTKLKWPNDFPCAFCGSTGKCRACALMDQKDAACFNCKGEGIITFQGKTATCNSCDGTKKCVVCKATGQCDFCGGAKKVGPEKVKELIAKKSAPPEGDKPEEPKQP